MYDNLARLSFTRGNSGENVFYKENYKKLLVFCTHRQKHKSAPMYKVQTYSHYGFPNL